MLENGGGECLDALFGVDDGADIGLLGGVGALSRRLIRSCSAFVVPWGYC